MNRIVRWSLSGLLITILLSCTTKQNQYSLPRIKALDTFSVTLEWQTTKPEKGVVLYGADGEPLRKVIDENISNQHRLKIGGLLPATRYRYAIDGLDRQFAFQTPQTGPGSFRFCIVAEGSVSADSIEQALPDFVVLTTSAAAMDEKLANLATSVPIYIEPFSFNYGEFTFCSSSDFFKAPDSNQEVGTLPPHSDQKSVLIDSRSCASSDSLSGDGIRVVFCRGKGDLAADTTQSLRHVFLAPAVTIVEVQGKGMRAGKDPAPEAQLPVVVLKEELSYARTCVHCRRLLDAAQYQRSIESYRQFIAGSDDNAMIDDALYRIASIHDRYLFAYPDALRWYKDLIARFPHSSTASLARFRIAYIESHADSNYVPLAAFERARLMLQTDRRAAIDTVETAFGRFGTTSLRDEMLLWLGGAHEQIDTKKAASYLEMLFGQGKTDEMRYRGGLKAADMYYARGDYRLAASQYRKLLESFPQKQVDLGVKIRQAMRNRHRQWLAAGTVFSIICVIVAVALAKPYGLKLPPAGLFSGIALIYLLAGSIPFIMYFEHLAVTGRYALLLFALMLTVSWIVIEAGRKLSCKKCRSRVTIMQLVPLAIILACCSIYIASYFSHYLFVFEQAMQ